MLIKKVTASLRQENLVEELELSLSSDDSQNNETTKKEQTNDGQAKSTSTN